MTKRTNGTKCPPLHRACKIFPPLDADQLNDLASDIATNGLLNPIVMLDDKLLDGRNRFAACKIANVEPRFVEFEGEDPIGWLSGEFPTRTGRICAELAMAFCLEWLINPPGVGVLPTK